MILQAILSSIWKERDEWVFWHPWKWVDEVIDFINPTIAHWAVVRKKFKRMNSKYLEEPESNSDRQEQEQEQERTKPIQLFQI